MNDSRTETEGALAIIAGGGPMPMAVADAAIRRGRRVFLFPVVGWAAPGAIETYPHVWINLVSGGKLVRHARAQGCSEVVFIGTAVRPPFRSLRIDWGTLRMLPKIWRAYRGGDDHLLSGLGRMLEGYGFRMVGAHEVAPDILMPEGPIGRVVPTERDRADIARGLQVLHALGPFDVGQAAVVANNQVLAVEGVEGTDGLLARIADMRERGRVAVPKGTGVLVKAPKPAQDRRFDLPTIGPKTVEGAARAGLAGLAVAAGNTIIVEPDAVAATAERAGLFVVGVHADGPPA